MNKNLFHKEYLCMIEGTLRYKNMESLTYLLLENLVVLLKDVLISTGQPSKTIYEIIKVLPYPSSKYQSLNDIQTLSFVKCKLETGRTHQIRVHFSNLGHPLLGDTLYGNPSPLISRQALHSYMVSFIHPITKAELCFTCPLPDDMKKLLI